MKVILSMLLLAAVSGSAMADDEASWVKVADTDMFTTDYDANPAHSYYDLKNNITKAWFRHNFKRGTLDGSSFPSQYEFNCTSLNYRIVTTPPSKWEPLFSDYIRKMLDRACGDMHGRNQNSWK